jgi:hypothetical protein
VQHWRSPESRTSKETVDNYALYMPKTKLVPKVAKIYPSDPVYPAGPLEVLLWALDRIAVFETNVFDIGEDIFQLIKPEFHSSDEEYVYDNRCIVKVTRNRYFCISSVNIRFVSAKIAERLLGRPSKRSKTRLKAIDAKSFTCRGPRLIK